MSTASVAIFRILENQALPDALTPPTLAGSQSAYVVPISAVFVFARSSWFGPGARQPGNRITALPDRQSAALTGHPCCCSPLSVIPFVERWAAGRWRAL